MLSVPCLVSKVLRRGLPRRTNLHVYRVDPDLRGPAPPVCYRAPRLLNRDALCQQHDDRLEVRHHQARHHAVQAPSEDPVVIDPQDQQTDAAFQQCDVREEEDLRHPRQEADVFIVCCREVPAMTPVAMPDGQDLQTCANEGEDGADYNGIVVLCSVSRSLVMIGEGLYGPSRDCYASIAPICAVLY
jgi:hypothetical protein